MYSPFAKIFLSYVFLSGVLPFLLACQFQEGHSPEGKRIARARQIVEAEQKPLHIFGILLDQENRPVEGAKVRLQIARWYLPTVSLSVHDTWVKTNEKGVFQYEGPVGESISVEEIKMVGYEYSRPQAMKPYFDVRESKTTLPDAQHPLILRMRKKGPETFLTQGGGGFSFTNEESGTYKGRDFFRESPFPIKEGELAHPTVYGQPVVCDLRAQATFDPRTGSWTVVLAPGNPEGGIQSSDQLFYEAPATGYQPSLTFKVERKVSTDAPDEANFDVKMPVKFLYLRSRKAPIYSRIEMGERFTVRRHPSQNDPKTLISEFHFGASAILNPFGDRILEEATDLPGEVKVRLGNEVLDSYKKGIRPPRPDLPKLVEEWKKNRPVAERVKEFFKR
jgi:hypothetical protein